MSPASASPSPALLAGAQRLHAYLLSHHLHDGQLAGADQGVRWNIRIWRFVKSYLPMLRPQERYYFLQGQAYLAFASWTLGDITGEAAYHQAARAATRVIRETQRADGARCRSAGGASSSSAREMMKVGTCAATSLSLGRKSVP